MLRKLLTAFALVVLLGGGVAACSTNSDPVQSEQGTARNVQATAELSFQAALKAVDVEVKAGRLKGARAAEVAKALRAAKAALDTSRAAVNAGRFDAFSLATAALTAVANVTVILYPEQS